MINRASLAFLSELLHLWLLCCGSRDESAGSGTGLYPVDVQQGFVVFGGRIVHQHFENPFEVGEGIGSVAAHLLDEGVDGRAAPVGFLAADEHSVLVIEFLWEEWRFLSNCCRTRSGLSWRRVRGAAIVRLA